MIMVGTVVKAKVGELEEDIMEGFFGRFYEGDVWYGAGGGWEDEVFGEVPGCGGE